MQTDAAGRGPQATADMKARIAAIQKETWRMDVLIDRLWERNRQAVVEGQGFQYEYAAPGSEQVRPAR